MRFLVALFAVFLSLAACAEQSSKQAYVAGEHYIVLDQPVRTVDPDKIEVAEVFSYHCGHCFNFEPALQAWKKQQPDDVVVVQTHAIWNQQMENLARGYYTIMALGIKEQAHMAVFNAIHLHHKSLNTAEQWADFLSAYGTDKASVLKTFNSFGVGSQVKQASARARGYGITGTPELVVNGKYRITSSKLKSQEEMLQVAEFLIEKERTEKK